MAGSFFLGDRFASHVPHVHMEDCRVPLKHSEILLLVDVPRWHVRQVEVQIRKAFPDVEVGGVSWTVEAFGI
jgi:hypothetical protein